MRSQSFLAGSPGAALPEGGIHRLPGQLSWGRHAGRHQDGSLSGDGHQCLAAGDALACPHAPQACTALVQCSTAAGWHCRSYEARQLLWRYVAAQCSQQLKWLCAPGTQPCCCCPTLPGRQQQTLRTAEDLLRAAVQHRVWRHVEHVRSCDALLQSGHAVPHHRTWQAPACQLWRQPLWPMSRTPWPRQEPAGSAAAPACA